MAGEAAENEKRSVWRSICAQLTGQARLDRTDAQQAAGARLNADQLALLRNRDQILAPLRELEALAAQFASLGAARTADCGTALVWMLVRFLRHASITRHVPTSDAVYNAAVERVLEQVYEADAAAVETVEKLYAGAPDCIEGCEGVTCGLAVSGAADRQTERCGRRSRQRRSGWPVCTDRRAVHRAQRTAAALSALETGATVQRAWFPWGRAAVCPAGQSGAAGSAEGVQRAGGVQGGLYRVRSQGLGCTGLGLGRSRVRAGLCLVGLGQTLQGRAGCAGAGLGLGLAYAVRAGGQRTDGQWGAERGVCLTRPTMRTKKVCSSTERRRLTGTALSAAKDHAIRETWIRAMEMRLVKEDLDRCYRTEGVDHYEKCRELSDRYWRMLRQDYRVRGYLGDERMARDV
ncbi:hypothetical protein PMAC_002540 [Pneumocystis sp. 'macacae']|nr:hypothetical protein PMAC_002540 [Pneumocystis sp. 'macacae']